MTLIPLDLDDIERRINDGSYGDDRMSDTARDDAFSALAEIIAEVERLRALEADAERALVKAELWNYYAAFVAANGAGSITELVVQRDEARAAVGAERAAVVAWLREQRAYGTDELLGQGFRNVCGILSDAIERGEHRREGGE